MVGCTTNNQKTFGLVMTKYTVDRSRPSKGTHFKAGISIGKNGQARVTIPPEVIQREDIRNKNKVEFEIKSIKD